MTIRLRYVFILIVGICLTSRSAAQQTDPRFLAFKTKASDIRFYWKNDSGEILGSLQNLKSFVESKDQKLRFAMNGGMYNKDSSPQGLFIENGIQRASLDSLAGSGNFYLKPNGVFYIGADGKAMISKTENFMLSSRPEFATQSGPMLIIDGEMHPAFIKGSKNLNIRNGVGIMPDNSVVFVMSKEVVNFYDFAQYFKNLGCRNAVYLDGFVSRTFLPEQGWIQLDGSFGVMIGVVE